MATFKEQLHKVYQQYFELIATPNAPINDEEGYVTRYKNPVFTADHFPPNWMYDLNEETNPYCAKRLGVNGVLNPGAIYLNGKTYLMLRVEGYDRKSFFAIAESENGIDNFKVWEHPVVIPQHDNEDTNVYDMRLTQHEDGYIYGLFCSERKDPNAPDGDESAAVAACGIVRSKDMKSWERLPDLITFSGQQRNVVLHPEFIDGQYGIYTRPQDGFIDTGKGGGIGFGLTKSMENAQVDEEVIVDPKCYHTINEVKNGQGPAPFKTEKGWLHLAHGVRNTAAGLRYVLYMFMTDLKDPAKLIAKPSGYFMAPQGAERIGDVGNVLFVNGWVRHEDDSIYIYYASSDTRVHVAKSSVDQLVDYCLNTPADPLKSHLCVDQRIELIDNNKSVHEEMLKAFDVLV
ncbi:glycosidase [Persicobacter psychrovividus]|uniref:4-O-beta-D-mannosyl-D-glucose phosphorylase n=1 Tax=Persicobacter psychrovividus TaxID=387638 RepID=A0ABM7VLG4_9BACT|nr:4-O-beta-D-mannosyl-D-glucose phosphorylase [Persicobacter psychrovividus]